MSLAAAVAVGVLALPPASADPTPPAVPAATANADNYEIGLEIADDRTPAGEAEGTLKSSQSAPPLPGCDAVSAGVPCREVTVCTASAISPTGYMAIVYTNAGSDSQTAGGINLTVCEPPAPAADLPGAVLRAFQRIPLPEPRLDIQPPKGKTLIGLETILSTHAEPFTRTLTLLGRRVELRIHASSYEWIHGDGTTQTTDWAGRAWERGVAIERYIAHVYEDTGNFDPSVRVTWSADYRVGNGPWQTVSGTVDRTSPPAQLQVLEAEPKLVAP